MAHARFWQVVVTALVGMLLLGLASPTPAQTYSWRYDQDGNWGDSANWSGGVPNSPTAAAQFRLSFRADRVVRLAANAQGEPISVTLNKLIFWDLTRGNETLTIRAVQQGSQESLLQFTGAATLESRNTISATKAASLDSTGLAYLAALRIDAKVQIAGSSLTKTGSGSAVLFREVSGSGALNINRGLLILAAANTYTGATTVNSGGTLQVRHSQALGATSAGTLVQGGVLELAQDLAGGDLLISGEALSLQGGTLRNLSGQNVWQGPIALNGAPTLSAAAGSSLTLRGQFTGSGNITKLDSGRLVLDVASGSNYSGGTLNVAGGTLHVLGAGALRPAKFHNTSNNRAGVTVDIGGPGSQPQLLIQQFFHLGNDANAPITVNQYSGTVANAGTANQPSVSDMSRLANVWGGATNGTGNTSPVVYNLRGGLLDLRAAPLYLSWKADATLNIDGGAALLQGLVLGYETRDAYATVNLRSGDLYLAAGGIRADSTSQPFSRKQVNLYGGTLGALANWSYNNMNLHLLGPATIDTDDDYNITMTGQLLNSGSGMITKIGAGTLYLNGNIQINPQTQLDIEEGKVVINGVEYGSSPSGPLIVTGTLELIDWGFGDSQLQNLPRSARWLIVRGGKIVMTQSSEAPRAFTLDPSGATLEAAEGVTWRISVYPRADGSDRYPLVSNLTAGQNLTLTGAGTGQIDKVIPGAGGLVKTGSGTWILTGQNTYTGGTRIEAGTLQLSGGDDRLANTGNITITGGTLDLGGNTQNITDSAVVSFQGGVVQNGTINKAGGNYTTDGSFGTATVSAILAGSAGLQKTGTGTLVLAGNNTYQGPTTVSAGTLEIKTSSALGASSSGTTVGYYGMYNWGHLKLTPSTDTVFNEPLTLAGGVLQNHSGNNEWQGRVTISTSSIDSTVDVAAGLTLTFSGGMDGNHTLEKTSGGTLVLTTDNSAYTGPIRIKAGVLEIRHAKALGARGPGQGTTITDYYATLKLHNVQGGPIDEPLSLFGYGTSPLGTYLGALYNSAGDNTWSGPITLNPGSYLTTPYIRVDSGTQLTLSGQLTGTGGLYKLGDGTLVLAPTAANTYTGTTTVSGGVLEIRHANALGASGTGQGTTVASGATLQVRNVSGSIAEPLSLAGSGVSSVGALYNVAGNNTWSGAVTLTANTSIGAASGTQLTITGQISGGYTLTKVGAGTLVLEGNNTYSGGTTVTAGKLLVNNTSGSGTGSGAVTVKNQAVLGGTGTVGGDVTIQSGGQLTAGDVGTVEDLAIGGNLTMQSGSTWVVDILSASSWDLIDLTGAGKTASLTNVYVQVNVHGDFVPTKKDGEPDYSITILKAANINISGLSFSTPPAGHTAWNWAIVDLSGGQGTLYGLNLWAAPEPSTWLMLLVGGAGLGLLRWYRRRSAGQKQ